MVQKEPTTCQTREKLIDLKDIGRVAASDPS